MTTLFVSDLHLDASRPEATACFIRFLEGEAESADALYILGDLFEVWIGDEDPAPEHRAVALALSRLAASGTPCYFARGNRDFLIGAKFARDSGLHLLAERTIIDINDDRMLLMHGDELCIDDVSYQRLRRLVRNPLVQRLFLLMPLAARRSVAARLRAASMASEKPAYITDANVAAIENEMRAANVKILIHGHTHRPAIHQMHVDGEAALRIVLGDWHEAGSVLRWTHGGPELTTLPIAASDEGQRV